MEPRKSFWHGVAPGAYILDPNGETIWKVISERPGQVLLQRRDGLTRIVNRPDPFTPVTFMARTLAECEQMVAERLGATLEARKNDKLYRCQPIAPRAESALRIHMFMFHGTYVDDVKTMKGLLEAHDSQHADFDAGHDLHAYIAHTHAQLQPLGATA